MSRKIALLIVIMLASLAALNAYTLDGIVLSAPEMEPIEGATVMLNGFQGIMMETETDEAGNFIFENIEAGQYMLHVNAEEYFSFFEEVVVEEDVTIEVVLELNENPEELTGHLFGVVTTEDGDPVIGQEIVISTWNPNTQPHHVTYEAVTGEAGNYDFSEIVDFSDYQVVVNYGEPPYFTDVYVEGETEFDIVMQAYDPEETWTLSGTVTNEETGEAVIDMNIILQGWQGFMMETITDEAGNYFFEAVPEGEYNIMVHCFEAGFESFSGAIEIFEDTVFDIALVPYEQGELSLYGTVIDAETGDVISGANISLHGEQWQHYNTVSGEDGSYEFTGLFGGEYMLHAHIEEMTYMPFHAEVELEESMEFTIEMEAYEIGDITLNGTVTNAEGDPQAEQIVHLWGENTPGGMAYMSITDENGYYEINEIIAGEYVLHVSGMNGLPAFEEEIVIEEDMTYDIVIDDQPGEDGNLSGNVINVETGEMVPGVQIIIQHGWQVYETVSGEAGQYAFENIPTQNYQIVAFADGFHQFNSQIEVEEDTVYEINLEPFEMGDFTLSGEVTDIETGDIVNDVHIQLFNIEMPNYNYNVFTNEAGYYEIEGIFEGTYQMMAWTNGWSQYEPFEAVIDIMESMVFNIELVPIEMPGTGAITGFIYDLNTEEPLANAFVNLAPVESNPGGGCWNFYETTTDEEGYFEFQNVETNEYIMAAEAEGYLMSFFDGVSNPEDATVIPVVEEEVISLEMYLTPLVFYSVSGNVADFATGNPMEEVSVSALQPGSGCNHWAVAEAITDINGDFVLEVPQGDYIFVAQYGEFHSEDFMQQFFDHKQSPASADVVTVDQDITGIDFELTSPESYDNRISGTITVGGNLPENPVLVAAVSETNQWEAASVTDLFGNYQLNNLPEGNYYILAYEFNSVPTYYPGVVNYEDAVTVNALGIVTGIDFELIVPENTGVLQVDGYVTDHNGNPVTNANVIITDDQDNVISYAVTNNQGYYLANGLPAGSLAGLATKIHYNSDEEDINVTSTGSADFVIIPEGTTDSQDEQILPNTLMLSNYPNPFNPTTTISFSLNETGYTTLDIYNITGQKVNTIVEENLSAGDHQIAWDGTDLHGNTLASGMYFYKLTNNNQNITKKMVLMK